VIIASTRPQRHGPAIGQWVIDTLADRHGPDISLVDLAAYGLRLLDEPEPAQSRAYTHEHTRAWRRTIDDADGFIMILPEHNRSMPASAKNALDALYWEWQYKPIAFVSYSGGMSGGIRVVEMTSQVAVTLAMLVPNAMVNLPCIDSLASDGRFEPPVGASAALHPLADDVEKYLGASAILRTA
jgi:NAD(P)H-dependent FMN reductase